jgi:hypothetical protein
VKRCLLSGVGLLAVVFGTSCTPALDHGTAQTASAGFGSPPSHIPPIGGDPAVYAAAIAEISSYLMTWVKLGPAAAAASYLTVAPEEQTNSAANSISPAPAPADVQPQPDSQMPVLIGGSVYSYVPWMWESADHFTLYVTLDLHFSGDPGRANWYEGHNGQFFTFSRVPAQTSWRMATATAP